MALTIVATVGSASANSFVTLEEYAAHMESRLNASAFGAAELEKKKASLLEAARELQVLPYIGSRVDTTQALPWPRKYAVNPDAPEPTAIDGLFFDDAGESYYAEDVIPDRIKRAQIELAFEFLRAGTTDIASLERGLDVKRRKVDVIETEYVDVEDRAHRLARFPTVMRELRPLLMTTMYSRQVDRL